MQSSPPPPQPPPPSAASSGMATSTTPVTRFPPHQSRSQSVVSSHAKHSAHSLYQRCLELSRKLALLPGFTAYLDEALHALHTTSPDPVTLLWTCFRYGTPLCALMNHLRPGTVPQVNPLPTVRDNANLAKSNVYHFLLACRNARVVREEALFTISDLYRDDTNGFVKIVGVVEALVEQMQIEGLLVLGGRLDDGERGVPSGRLEIQSGGQHMASSGLVGMVSPSADPMESKLSNRERVLTELLETERKYVADLETLQAYKHHLRDQNAVPQAAIRDLFCNIDRLVDFQRKFLIAMEDACQVPGQPHIGLLFTQNEEAFAVYGPYCANHHLAAETAIRLNETLQKHKDRMEPTHELPSFLIRPIQRICRYPLLLRELVKVTDDASPQKLELMAAFDASNRIAQTINEIKRKQENAQLKRELETKVEDWKGFNIREFGDLLLDSNVIMARRDIEKEVHMFLFERILICCKEVRKEKKKSLIRRSNSRTQIVSQFQLKGGVTITEIERVVSSTKKSDFELQVYYKDYDTGDLESFVLKFLHEEPLKSWKAAIEQLLEKQRRRSAASAAKRNSRRRASEAASFASRNSVEHPSSPGRSMSTTSDRHSRDKNMDYVHYQSGSTTSSETQRRSRASRSGALDIVPEYRSSGSGSQNTGLNVNVTGLSSRAYISPLHSPTTILAEENKNRFRAKSTRTDFLSNLDKAMNELELLQDELQHTHQESKKASSPLKPHNMSFAGPSGSQLANQVYPVPSASDLATPRRMRASPTTAPPRSTMIKTKVHVGSDIFVLFLSTVISYDELIQKVVEKIDTGTELVQAGQHASIIKKMTYQDEDGDFITLGGDDDVRVAMRLATAGQAADQSLSKRSINLYIELQ